MELDYLSKWESKKDGGIYDGFNRGLTYATGDLIGIINSGDEYTNKAFDLLLEYKWELEES